MSKAIIEMGDCITGIASALGDNSIDCIITSIPFGSLFSYSGKNEDVGNCQDGIQIHATQFAVHLRFSIEQMFRVLKPGHIACIHVQQLYATKIQHNYMGMRDFRGSCILMFEAHGFQSHGEVAIVKDPRNIARRNNLHSLMFATAKRDSHYLAPAMNDYFLFFQKPGESENPVQGIIETNTGVILVEPSPIIEYVGSVIKKVRPDYQNVPYQIEVFDEASGKTSVQTVTGGEGINPDGWFTKQDWIRWARGAWEDILEIDTLQGWRNARENEDERHPAPLQLEPVRRCIKLYTNPGDWILEPYMGIGTVGYVAIEQGRNCYGFELKESFHKMAVDNCKRAQTEEKQEGLF